MLALRTLPGTLRKVASCIVALLCLLAPIYIYAQAFSGAISQFKNNTGGLNSKSSPISISDSEASEIINFNLDTDGAIKKRSGYQTIVAVANTYKFDGLSRFNYYSQYDTSNIYTVSFSDAVYSMRNLNGTLIAATAALYESNPSVVITQGTKVRSTEASGLWFFGDGVKDSLGTTCLAYLSYVGGANVFEYVNIDLSGYASTNFNIKCIATFDGNIFFVFKDRPNRVYYSEPLTTEFDPNNYIDIGPVDGWSDEDSIEALKAYAGGLSVFKKNHIYNIRKTGDDTIPYSVEQSKSDIGTVNQDSIQLVNNYLLFLSSKGLAFFDGVQSKIISYKIQPTLEALNKDDLYNANSCIYETKNQYWLCVTNSSTPNDDVIIVYDYYIRAFYIYKGIHADQILSVRDENNTEVIVHTDYNGWMYKNDVFEVYSDYPENTKTAINASYVTKDYDLENMLLTKKPIYLNVFYGYDNDTDGSLLIKYTMDLKATDWRTFTMPLVNTDTGGRIYRVDLTGSGVTCRIKFENDNDEPVSLYGWALGFSSGEVYRNYLQ